MSDRTITEETITIEKSEYLQLLKDSRWLECLNAAGVDNWQGIDVAQEMWREDEQD